MEQWTESFGSSRVSIPLTLPTEDLWHQLIGQIKELVASEDFNRWFEDMMFLDIQDDRLLIQVPRKLDALWINNHYLKMVNALLGQMRPGLKAEIVCP